MHLVGIHHVGIKVGSAQQWQLWASFFLQFNRQAVQINPNQVVGTCLAPTLLLNPYGGGGLGVITNEKSGATTNAANGKGWAGVQLQGFNPTQIQAVLKADHIPSYISTHASGKSCITAEDALGITWQFLETQIRYKQRNLPNGGVIGVQLKTSRARETAIWWQSLFTNLTVQQNTEKSTANADIIENAEKYAILTSQPTKTAMQSLWQPCQIEIIPATERPPLLKNERVNYVAFEVSDIEKLHQILKAEKHTDTVLQQWQTEQGVTVDYFFTKDPTGNAVAFCQTRQIPLLPKNKWLLKLAQRKKPLRQWHKNLLYASLQKLTPVSP